VDSREKRLYLAVALCAVLPHLPALWNRFAMDDLYIIAWNPLVHSLSGVFGAFTGPYWPPDLGGQMYRPLPLASFALTWGIVGDHPLLFHAMNLLWHAAVAVAVTALAQRLAGFTAALAAGLLFAVHPIHTEAVTGIVTGEGAPSRRTFTILGSPVTPSSGTPQQDVAASRCDRLALLAMSKPGKFQFAIVDVGSSRVGCKLIARTP